GRGFAVVADEIGNLATNSKNTASRIQEISAEVTEAVQSLASNASEMITFINETVLHDYDAFVESGENYNVTADIMDDLLSQFTKKAENLHGIMNDMALAVEDITSSVSESTRPSTPPLPIPARLWSRSTVSTKTWMRPARSASA
ncbi:MAG: hypothetical protein IIU40_08305, partial [Lachnospiraceae bacterium]|nr:hypothetical protein [Lachnospiraceae bacterium]